MKLCWNSEPKQRPGFLELYKKLNKLRKSLPKGKKEEPKKRKQEKQKKEFIQQLNIQQKILFDDDRIQRASYSTTVHVWTWFNFYFFLNFLDVKSFFYLRNKILICCWNVLADSCYFSLLFAFLAVSALLFNKIHSIILFLLLCHLFCNIFALNLLAPHVCFGVYCCCCCCCCCCVSVFCCH